MRETLYVGLDVHKDSIAAAGFRAGRSKEPVFERTCPTDEASIRRFFGGLKRRYRVQACYEAGCMGFWLQRLLEGMDITCRVVAPSMLPRKPGDRVKTDRRDARKLAAALRSEDIEGIFVPGPGHEAIRDLIRTREDLRIDALRQKHRLNKFLLRRNKIYRDGKSWTMRHLAWLKTLEFEEPADRYTFHMYFLRMQQGEEQLKEMDRRLESIALAEPFAESVGKLRCLKGVEWLTAFTFVVEVGDFRRFRSAGSFMAFLGMVPAEFSSGERRTRGSITKTGNSHLRRLLVEAAWHYRHPFSSRSPRLIARRAGQPAHVIAHAERATIRLHGKFRALALRNKPHHKIVTAVGRELAGFIWSFMIGAEAA